MKHEITFVAQSQFLDPAITARVAQSSTNVFLIGGRPYVDTWTADAFIAEVEAAQGDAEANERIRRQQIALYMRGVAAGRI